MDQEQFDASLQAVDEWTKASPKTGFNLDFADRLLTRLSQEVAVSKDRIGTTLSASQGPAPKVSTGLTLYNANALLLHHWLRLMDHSVTTDTHLSPATATTITSHEVILERSRRILQRCVGWYSAGHIPELPITDFHKLFQLSLRVDPSRTASLLIWFTQQFPHPEDNSNNINDVSSDTAVSTEATTTLSLMMQTLEACMESDRLESATLLVEQLEFLQEEFRWTGLEHVRSRLDQAVSEEQKTAQQEQPPQPPSPPPSPGNQQQRQYSAFEEETIRQRILETLSTSEDEEIAEKSLLQLNELSSGLTLKDAEAFLGFYVRISHPNKAMKWFSLFEGKIMAAEEENENREQHDPDFGESRPRSRRQQIFEKLGDVLGVLHRRRKQTDTNMAWRAAEIFQRMEDIDDKSISTQQFNAMMELWIDSKDEVVAEGKVKALVQKLMANQSNGVGPITNAYSIVLLFQTLNPKQALSFLALHWKQFNQSDLPQIVDLLVAKLASHDMVGEIQTLVALSEKSHVPLLNSTLELVSSVTQQDKDDDIKQDAVATKEMQSEFSVQTAEDEGGRGVDLLARGSDKVFGDTNELIGAPAFARYQFQLIGTVKSQSKEGSLRNNPNPISTMLELISAGKLEASEQDVQNCMTKLCEVLQSLNRHEDILDILELVEERHLTTACYNHGFSHLYGQGNTEKFFSLYSRLMDKEHPRLKPTKKIFELAFIMARKLPDAAAKTDEVYSHLLDRHNRGDGDIKITSNHIRSAMQCWKESAKSEVAVARSLELLNDAELLDASPSRKRHLCNAALEILLENDPPDVFRQALGIKERMEKANSVPNILTCLLFLRSCLKAPDDQAETALELAAQSLELGLPYGLDNDELYDRYIAAVTYLLRNDTERRETLLRKHVPGERLLEKKRTGETQEMDELVAPT